MPTVPGKRHSVTDRPGGEKGERHTPHDRKADHTPAFVTEDRAEHLAEVMSNVGSDYLIGKVEDKYDVHDIPASRETLLHGADPHDVANRVIKAAAREMERAETQQHGHIDKGSLAAQAAVVAAHKDDPSHPAHKVAEKIRERFVEAETLAERGTMFVGVNPDAGRESKQGKMRHHANITGHKITAGTRHDRNPDVIKD